MSTDEKTSRFAAILVEAKAKIHRGKSADYVHGYWKGVDDIAARYGITLDPQTDFSNKVAQI